ncbi:MAG: prepilin-type N-terminal cleavage/methylation domain-containing protein [Planctomycetes bacterium]|nr:prepilin-type N-terminal cleavage/methylation domain-containing protein [Planctomycetota bacterium]
MKQRGFTLIEMLVVIVIIVILVGASVAMINVFFRGQGVRQGALIVTQAIAQAKQLAADKRSVHFVVFENKPDGGEMRIYQDTSAPFKEFTLGDTEIEQRPIGLSKHVRFRGPFCPAWLGVEPSGYVIFSPGSISGGGFMEVHASWFEGQLRADPPVLAGDIVLEMASQRYFMCMDVDRAGGKIRRSHFVTQ